MKIKWLILIIVIGLSFIGLIYFFRLGGAIAAILETILIYVLSNPDKAIGFLASLYKKGRKIHFWFEKSAVEKRLESTIGLASKKVNEEEGNLLPHGVDIEWIDIEKQDRDAFLREDKIVVCLEPSINEEKNLARATMLYTSEDLIRESQRFVNKKVMRAACFAVARKMLMIDRRIGALKCLNEEFLTPEISKDPQIKGHLEVMEKLDLEGCFTRVLLRELSELDAKLSPATSHLRAEEETASFMQIMKKLAEKQKGVDIYPTHRGNVIDVDIILVAREGVTDPNPYIKYAKRCWNKGVPRLYVLAQEKNTIVAVSAVLAIKTSGIYRVEKEWNFWILGKGGKFKSYIAALDRIGVRTTPSIDDHI